jgi:hypothetical protein
MSWAALQTLEAPDPECRPATGLPLARSYLSNGEVCARDLCDARPPPAGVLEPPLVNESFPSFLDEDSDSGNDSLAQAFEFSGHI